MDKYFDETGKVFRKPKNINSEWRISCYVIIRSDVGKILMVQPTWNNNWELPGGGIEKEESIKAGIVRECYEETGYRIVVTTNEPISVGERNFYSKALDKFFKSVILVYSGDLVNDIQDQGVINSVEKDEIASVSWIKPEELKQSNVNPIVWPSISKFLQTQK